ncbi:hypothetical protein GOP47_0025083 [Adiantum capillus-veneris]|uniref:Uncharacterized protein n=1 Tax=Adiantum capillus-veneris TaxID=13818 RepID=A0A9D4U461_ADICA|nr:hypothetical protein GOP47_0025083 [Adiantum capillus-veneris]
MNMGSLSDRCSVHPQRRVIGICAHCLHERLTLLIESISPEDGAGQTHVRQMGGDEEQKRPPIPPTRPHSSSHGRSAASITMHNPKASAEMAFHSHAKLEDSLNVALQKVKQAHQQLSFVAQSPYQGVIKVGPASSPLPNGQNEKPVSMPASCQQSNASESDMKLFPSGKRRNSWFSMSRGKSSLLNAPLLPDSYNLDDKNGSQKSPQVMVLAGRKSASDAIGRSSNSYRQAYMAELESIAEINLGEAAIKVEPNESNGDVHANPSWISSLFQRRKGSRYKTDERQDAGMNYSAVGSKVQASLAAPDASANRSPLPSLEAGRLSWDGPRPSFKQMLKRIEARKKQQRVDCSPLHSLATTNGGNECLEDVTTPGQAAASALQKCKSVAASRKSRSIEMQRSSKQASSVSLTVHSNENMQIEYGNGDMIDREERSWGRAWNKTLSPLLGFRNYGRRGAFDSGHQQHPGYATPNHVNFKSSQLGAPPSASSYMSPLSRSQCAPDAQIQIAQ